MDGESEVPVPNPNPSSPFLCRFDLSLLLLLFGLTSLAVVVSELAALKRAYAEVILNTAREAASRFADADRRAARFHRELCFARDEAVRMFVKLKRMLDAKTIEAETTVARKEEKIEELEAQLEEAESKILDLRMELENVRDELEIEKAKNNPQSSAGNRSSSDSDLSDHHINSLEPIVPYLSDPELNNAANQNKERLMTDREMVQMSCNGIDTVGQLAGPGPEDVVNQKTDLATMVIERKEPELYRNRCTQRVRAFEGHLLQGTLGCELNSSSCDKGENEMPAFAQSRNLEILKMIPNHSHITESSRFHLGQATPIEVKSKPKEFDNIGTLNEENSEGSTGSGFFTKEGDKLKEFPVSTKHKDDIAVNNVLVPYEESEPGSNSVNSDVDVERNVQEDGRCVQSEDNRLVKYTFQRKRKKAFLSNDSENKAPPGNTVKKHAGNLMKSLPEAKACKSTNESSRDSRRLAQVARQLIALSGKRW